MAILDRQEKIISEIQTNEQKKGFNFDLQLA